MRSNGRRFDPNLDTLLPSLPSLSQPLGLLVCLTRTPQFSGFALASRVYVASLPLAPFTQFPAAGLWLKDESLEDSANLPDPDVIAQEIVEDLEAALQQFTAIANDLKK
jgi:hypothetical protein